MQNAVGFLTGVTRLIGYFVGVFGTLAFLPPVLKALGSPSADLIASDKLMFILLLTALLGNLIFGRLTKIRPCVAAGLMGMSGLLVLYCMAMIGQGAAWHLGNGPGQTFYEQATLAVFALLITGAMSGFVSGFIRMRNGLDVYAELDSCADGAA